MNKSELIDKIIAEGKSKDVVSHAQMERIVNSVFDNIKSAVADGDTVQIAGFGTFKSAARAATTAKNPRTGETVQVPAKTVPKFSAATAFKAAVNK